MNSMEAPIFSFEKLKVWQKARLFHREVFRLTTSFPYEQNYALIPQIRRAALSVPSNISEGAGRLGSKEFVHFISIAYGSLMETMNQLILAEDLGYVTKEMMVKLRLDVAEIARMLTALKKKVECGAKKATSWTFKLLNS